MARKKYREYRKLAPKEPKSLFAFARETIFGCLPALPPLKPEPAVYLNHDAIMRSIFIDNAENAVLVHAILTDADEYETVCAVCPWLFIDSKYHRLLQSAPTLYKQLAVARDAFRHLEQFAHDSAQPNIEDWAFKNAEACNAAMMVATHGIDAVIRIIEYERTEQEKRNKL